MSVSILVCTHGDDRWSKLAAERAVPSAEAQNAREVIVVHERDSTLAEVRNHAADLASSDVLVFLDADDELEPGYLDAMRPWTEPRLALVGGELPTYDEYPCLLVPSARYVHRNRTPDRTCSIPSWGSSLIELNCAVIGTAIPRELFLRIGGFREWPAYEDFELWIRCVRSGAILQAVPTAVYRAYSSPNGRNTQRIHILQKAYDDIRAEHMGEFDWANVAAYKRGVNV